jgi:glycosyltransferase involved in cell wall biosynthesis
MTIALEIVVPVYNEGRNIHRALGAFAADVRSALRVLVVYDHDDDDTLTALSTHAPYPFEVRLVKNQGRGVFGAVTTGFDAATASAILVWPADDDYNAARIDGMVERLQRGCDIVAASRFMPGGRMVGCPWLKALIVRSSAFVLHHVARLPTHDPSNGLRLFSRRVIRTIPLESDRGFTYSIELLVKTHRLRWRICEVPFEWHERTAGRSRFRVLQWLPAYFVWFRYAFATALLRRGPQSVRLREPDVAMGQR